MPYPPNTKPVGNVAYVPIGTNPSPLLSKTFSLVDVYQLGGDRQSLLLLLGQSLTALGRDTEAIGCFRRYLAVAQWIKRLCKPWPVWEPAY